MGFCIPCGIGDASWLYAKLCHLPELLGRHIYVSMPDAKPQRGHQLFDYTPAARWGGYEPAVLNEQLFEASLPANAKLADFTPDRWHALQVNTWLEKGGKLADWLPWLPVNYHYPLSIPWSEQEAAANLVRPFGGEPYVAVYVSNRDKDRYRDWSLWTAAEWVTVLLTAFPERPFVLLGAEYDRDKTVEVAARLADAGRRIRLCLGQPLGVTLEVLRQASCCLSYPSGIGILANVVRTPTLMLLPRPLRKMVDTYADPEDVTAGRYGTLVAPTIEEALCWLGERRFDELSRDPADRRGGGDPRGAERTDALGAGPVRKGAVGAGAAQPG